MSELMTPRDAYLTALILHTSGFDVHVVMQHVNIKTAVRYEGDEARRAGKTALVEVLVRFDTSLDEKVQIRDRISELGFESELSSYGNFSITGRSAVS